MNKLIKNHFAGMQNGTVVAMCVVCMLVWSCQSKNEAGQPLSDELITSNLSIDGSINPELLIGEWDCIKFAYTADGSKISGAVAISESRLRIPSVPTPIENNDEPWILDLAISNRFICSLDGNLIKLRCIGSTSYLYIMPPHEMYDIILALENAYSFVIKGDILFFYFTGIEKYLTGEGRHEYTEKIKNKNLLILKKR